MFDFGSSWSYHRLFPAQHVTCGCCGQSSFVTSGVLCGENEDDISAYIAHIPAPCAREQAVTVHIRSGPLTDDSPPAEITESYTLWVSNGKARVAATEGGRQTSRDLVSSFEGEDDYDRIDLVARADEHIWAFLQGRAGREHREGV
jgi:hypothetical protein